MYESTIINTKTSVSQKGKDFGTQTKSTTTTTSSIRNYNETKKDRCNKRNTFRYASNCKYKFCFIHSCGHE